jgi:hypothetical protein
MLQRLRDVQAAGRNHRDDQHARSQQQHPAVDQQRAAPGGALLGRRRGRRQVVVGQVIQALCAANAEAAARTGEHSRVIERYEKRKVTC